MRNKRLISIGVAVLGVILIIYAISAMGRIADAKGKVSRITSWTSGTEGGRYAGRKLSDMASQYDTKVLVLLIAGIALTVVGCGGAYYYRKHRR